MPLPKVTQGALITAAGWNNMIDEIDGKLSKAGGVGGIMTGPLEINMDSSVTPHVKLVETQANDYARLGFYNSNIADQRWVIAGRLSAQAGVPSRLSFWHSQRGDVLSLVNDGRVEIPGGNWDVIGTEGDLRIGSAAHRLKIGVALGGGGAGDVRIRAVGGTNRLLLGGGATDTLAIGPDSVMVADNTRMSFGATVRQMINLWNTEYGIGVQGSTTYFRTGAHFGWHRLGVHSDTQLDPGAGGTRLMYLTSSGELVIIGSRAYKAGGGAWTDSSDRSLKTNIQPLQGALEKLLQLKGSTFEWKDPTKHGDLTGTQLGFIAQEVEKVFPDWIHEGMEGHKMLSIRGFEALVVEALRTLNNKIDQLSNNESTTTDAPTTRNTTKRTKK